MLEKGKKADKEKKDEVDVAEERRGKAVGAAFKDYRYKTDITRRKNILISSRNNQVSHVISGNYRSDTNDDAGTAVYCVSNRMYMRHLRGYDKSDEQTIPTMTPEQTQIPDLCSHIYALPSKGKTASLNHFVSNSTPTLLNIIQMSCSTTTLARADHLSGIVRNARKVRPFLQVIYLVVTTCADPFRP